MKTSLEIIKLLLLAVIASCSVILVLQGYDERTQNVYVKGGCLEVDNTLSVRGTVDVGNSVDVNLQYINGQRDVFFNNPKRGEKDKYYVLPVTAE